jgi:hypothetical protein
MEGYLSQRTAPSGLFPRFEFDVYDYGEPPRPYKFGQYQYMSLYGEDVEIPEDNECN